MSLCKQCGKEGGAGKMGLCPTCRLKLFSRVKFPWTPAMDDQLRQIYRVARKKHELSRGITKLQQQFGMPRCVLYNRAQTLGLRYVHLSFWSEEEMAFLRDNAGSMGVKKLAERLHRGTKSIKHKLFALGMSGRVTEGYAAEELRQLLSVSTRQMVIWLERGDLRRQDALSGRIAHDSVVRFIASHLEEISLRRAEEWWLKSILKEAMPARFTARRAA